MQTPNGVFELDNDDIYIRNHMSGGQVFESHIINGTIRPYIEKAKFVVDVGANIGCHAISYANFNPACMVWAFEPQEKLFDILQRNITRNNLGERVFASKVGVGHEARNAEMAPLSQVYDKNWKGHNKGGLGIGQGGESINIVTLDSLNLPGLDFLKIDVEGAEGLVIRGAAETIKKYKPTIFFEHNYQTIKPMDVGVDHVPTPFEELVKLGYKTFTYVDWENYITTSPTP